jgi:hypothetical protein
MLVTIRSRTFCLLVCYQKQINLLEICRQLIQKKNSGHCDKKISDVILKAVSFTLVLNMIGNGHAINKLFSFEKKQR